MNYSGRNAWNCLKFVVEVVHLTRRRKIHLATVVAWFRQVGLAETLPLAQLATTLTYASWGQ
jgi:hypothetical protein